MLRTFCVLTTTILLCASAYTQDLIVTAKGDTINAYITKIKKDYVHFVFEYDGEVRRTLLPVAETEYQKGYFDQPVVTEENLPDPDRFSRFRLGLVVGWSYLLGGTPEGIDPVIDRYYQNLKSSTHYGGDFDFFISELIGIGFRYRAFRTKQELDGVVFFNLEDNDDPESNGMEIGRLRDDMRVQFIGPSLVTHAASANNKIHFHSGIALGYVDYRNSAIAVRPLDLTGNSFGVLLEFGVDFMMDKNVSLGLATSLMSASLSSMDVERDGQKNTIKMSGETRENLSRVDISVSLKWYH